MELFALKTFENIEDEWCNVFVFLNEEKFIEIFWSRPENKLKKIKDFLVFIYVGLYELDKALAIVKTGLSSFVKKLEHCIKHFADNILSFTDPSSTHVFVIWILTVEVINHSKDTSSHLTFNFSPVNQPFWRFSFVNEIDETITPPVSISLNEVKSSSFEKMAIEKFENSKK